MQTWAPGHAVHDAPQCALSLLAAQLLSEHRWKLASQAYTHAVPLQVTEPFVGFVVVQSVQLAPHASAVVLTTHVGADAVPRWQ